MKSQQQILTDYAYAGACLFIEQAGSTSSVITAYYAAMEKPFSVTAAAATIYVETRYLNAAKLAGYASGLATISA